MPQSLIYVSNSVLPSKFANSVHVMKMCNAFSLNGFDVTLIGKSISSKFNKFSLFNVYDVDPIFQIKLFNVLRLPLSSVFISLFVIPFWIVLNRRQDSIVYSRNRHASFILSVLGVCHYYEMHGISANYIQDKLDRFICGSRALTRLVVISESLAHDIKDSFDLKHDKLVVAHDGADIYDLDSIETLRLNGNFKYNVGYVGSLLPGKGVGLLCDAALDLHDIGFHIVGGARVEVDEFKENYKFQNNIFFYGFVSHESTKKYLKAFDVVVLPNEKNVTTANGEDIGKYTSPLKMFEYLAFDKKIIASDLPVLREVLQGDYCFYFKAGDSKDLASVIRTTKNTKPAKSGRILVRHKYSWLSRAKLVLGIE
ncbi:glycosyltransferase family 4 protein [Thalassolituus pacificus]|uniref:Glycosyltransferase family 4 protein n=1 Tax=Thalassolituus pacificus TaxID=2975440 RepID=A0A9X3AGH5_9GAMM|nr:glycosyltransferase family 4 protein [Thalassolituus pacificus]MCT7358576.1 glycosyltransferase family 4 protein [Thalassolituus pacificus]